MPYCVQCGKGKSRLKQGQLCSNCFASQQTNNSVENEIKDITSQDDVEKNECIKWGTVESLLNICSNCLQPQLPAAINGSREMFTLNTESMNRMNEYYDGCLGATGVMSQRILPTERIFGNKWISCSIKSWITLKLKLK